jgi:cytochrome P450
MQESWEKPSNMLPRRSNFSLIDPPPGFVEDPYRVYAGLRTHEPVCWIGPHTVLLTRYRDVMTVYRAPAASSDKKREFGAKFGEHSPLFEHHTTSLVFSDPPLHTRVCRLLMSALHARAVAPMEGDLVRRVNELIDAIDTPGGHELVAGFAAPIPIEVIGNLLGIPARGRPQLRQRSLAILSALEPQPSALILAQGNRAVVEFSCFLRDLIGQRPQWGMLCAAEELVASAIEECLRYESPLQLNNRVLLQPLRLGKAARGLRLRRAPS